VINRRELLLSAAAAGAVWPSLVRAATAGDGRKLFVVFADGGWDVTYCMDPRLHHDTIAGPEVHEDVGNPDDREYLASYGENIQVALNDYKRPSVKTYMDKWADRTCFVNGIWIGSIAHPGCRTRMLTGSQVVTSPDISVIHGHTFIGNKPLGSVDMSGFSLAGNLAASTGRFGASNQIRTLVEPDQTVPGLGVNFPVHVKDPSLVDSTVSILRARSERLAARHAGSAANDLRLSDYDLSLDRAERFRSQSGSLLEDLVVGQRPGLLTTIYTGIDLLEADMCQSVFISSGSNWDTHNEQANQHDNYEQLFWSLGVLADELQARGLYENTTVLVLSEMTRTPKMNANDGKDHWPHGTAMAFGGGVKGGRTFGGTNNLMESMAMDLASGELSDQGMLCRYEHLAAGALSLLGGDSEQWFPGITPFTAWKA